MDPLIESILTEQIAGLRASAAVFVQQRADALALAATSAVQEAGATARADELQAALDAYRDQFETTPDEEEHPVEPEIAGESDEGGD